VLAGYFEIFLASVELGLFSTGLGTSDSSFLSKGVEAELSIILPHDSKLNFDE